MSIYNIPSFIDAAHNQTAEPAVPVVAPRRLFLILLLYLALLSLAETLTTALSTVNLGLIAHGLILVALFLQAGFITRRYEQRLYLTLAFAPLIRLVSLSLPLRDVPIMYWYAIIGGPLFISAWLAMRYAGFTRNQIGLTLRNWPLQVIFSFAGIGLGYLEYLILRPQPLAPAFLLDYLWRPAITLLVFTGFLEELIFRGLMQNAFLQGLGRWRGLLYVSILFAVLHLGYRSLLDFLFVFGVAVLLGLFSLHTGSILGVTLAHGLTNVTLFLVFPFMVGLPAIGGPLKLPANPAEKPVHAAPTTAATGKDSMPGIAALKVDNGDSGFSRSGGQSWQAEPGMDGDLVWALNSMDQATVVVVWTASLGACGLYQVEAYIPYGYATTQSLTYEVLHRDGAFHIVVDQNAFQGGWASLGQFWFDLSQPARVGANNVTGEADATTFVTFDAVRWTLVQPCSP